MTPIVSILIPSRNRLQLLKSCVKSWKTMAANPDAVEIIVRLHLDDLESLEWAIERPYDIQVVAGENYEDHSSVIWFINSMATCSSGDWIMPISDDFECLTQGWEKALHDAAGNPRDEFMVRHFECVNKPEERQPIITRGLYHAIGCYGHTSHADVYVDSLGWRLGINLLTPLPVKFFNHIGPSHPSHNWRAGLEHYNSPEMKNLLENDYLKVKMLMEKQNGK